MLFMKFTEPPPSNWATAAEWVAWRDRAPTAEERKARKDWSYMHLYSAEGPVAEAVKGVWKQRGL